ncbi:MAG: YggT family protein [Candidatus Delongbacteria bacterium]|nr:YggT family protein [Candidatus Delongbacteria bacterium]
MSLDQKFIPIRTAIYDTVGTVFEKIAGFFGYPDNPGMPTIYDMPNDMYARSQFFDTLPRHQTYWPPIQRPETWFEMIFGPAPKIDAVPRYIYESQDEGFYNFYIENYKNIYFLPDWLSEFIQIRLNICLDISLLETIREVLFIGLMIYSQMVVLRIAVSWLIYINPYTFPWSYLAAAVDWTEDVLQGIVPSILGVNITGSVFLGILGVVADSLNHLVFTMPFLPSEGEETKLLINDEMKDVLVFHYLPILWYRHPIPNNVREFWFYQKPEILEYMQKAYKDLDIQLLPNVISQELNQNSNLLSQLNEVSNSLSTIILSWKP